MFHAVMLARECYARGFRNDLICPVTDKTRVYNAEKCVTKENGDGELTGNEMARSAGIEPTTPAFGGQYSIH